jgi:hypothetical protein
MDPFYQQFLRAQFQCYDPIFKFPKAHDLLLRLETFLSKPPASYRPKDYGEKTFRIMIPYMEHKNPEVYNYLSDSMQRHFERRVREYFRDLIHQHISVMRRGGFTRKEIIDTFMEDHNLDSRYYDRIEREHKRYMNAEAVRKYKYAKKSRKTLSVKRHTTGTQSEKVINSH